MKIIKGDRLLTSSVLLGHLILGAAILYFQPYWGLQDDGMFIKYAWDMQTEGLWNFTWNSLAGELEWGMFRLFFMPQIYLTYGFFTDNSTGLFFWNFLLTSIITVLFCFSIARSVFFDSLKYLFWNSLSRTHFCLWLIGLTLIYPWYHYMFVIPAMQEKVVFLFAALTILCINSARLQRSWAFFPTIFVLMILGFCSKNQYVFLLPIFVLLQLQTDLVATGRGLWRTATVVLFGFCGTAILAWVASQGTYTAGGFKLENVVPNLEKSRSVYIFAALVIGTSALIIFQAFRNGAKSLTQTVSLLSGPACIVLFLLAMLPWRLGGYLNAFVGPLWAMCAVVFAGWLGSLLPRFRFALVPVLSVLIIVVSTQRAHFNFAYMGSIRHVLFSTEMATAVREQSKVFLIHPEGADRLTFYLHEFVGLQKAQIQFADAENPEALLSHIEQTGVTHTYWLENPFWLPIPSSMQKLNFRHGKIIKAPAGSIGMRLWRVPVSL